MENNFIAIVYADEARPTAIIPMPNDFNTSHKAITKLLECQWFEEVIPAAFQVQTAKNAVLLVDEEGRLNGSKYNRRASAISPGIVGNAILCIISEKDDGNYVGTDHSTLSHLLSFLK